MPIRSHRGTYPPTQTWLAVALLLTVAALPGSAVAHDLPRERTIMFEVSREAVRAMIVFQEPPGRRVRLLRAQFDFDNDGELRGPEADAAASSWVPYALRDLEIELDGQTVERETTRIKFRNEHNGAHSSAIYLEWDVSSLNPGETREITARRSGDAPPFASPVRCQTVGDLQFDGRPGAAEADAIGPLDLQPGDSVSIRIRRPRSSVDLPTRRP